MLNSTVDEPNTTDNIRNVSTFVNSGKYGVWNQVITETRNEEKKINFINFLRLFKSYL